MVVALLFDLFSLCASISFCAMLMFRPSSFSVTVTKLAWSLHSDRVV